MMFIFPIGNPLHGKPLVFLLLFPYTNPKILMPKPMNFHTPPQICSEWLQWLSGGWG